MWRQDEDEEPSRIEHVGLDFYSIVIYTSSANVNVTHRIAIWLPYVLYNMTPPILTQ
jgi:hypothetical protein